MRRTSKKIATAATVGALLVAVSSPVRAADIVDTAVGAGNFKTLAAALGAADLVNALKGQGPFTVLAPTDEAFAKLPAGTLETLLKPENKAQLVSILTYHVVPGKVPASKVVTLSTAPTLNGQRVDIRVADGGVTVDNAGVVKTDIECANGIIHVIDRVILPASDNIPAVAAQTGKFGTLLAAAKAAGLVEALSGDGPLTVFAPTDDAFAALPQGTLESLLKPENKATLATLLKFHVVPERVYSDQALAAKSVETLQGGMLEITAAGGQAKVNQANLKQVDIDASNGVIHVIDRVLLPAEPKKVGAAEARKMIEQAVARGVRQFNRGHHAACAETYATTMRTLVSQGQAMPPQALQNLTSALQTAEQSHCPIDTAWTLRHGLDRAYDAMRDLDRR